MVNKNMTKILDNHKILHKKGKHWITISVALLGAIGGGAVATNATVNADQTNNTQSQPQITQVLKTGTDTTAKAVPQSSVSTSVSGGGYQYK